MTNQSELNQKAETLLEALGWIQKFRDKTSVVRLDGNVLDNSDELDQALLSIQFMQTVGFRPVVVHGSGSRLDLHCSIEDASRVLVDELNRELADRFEKIGGRAMTLNFQSTPVLTGKSLGADEGVGRIGEVTQVDRLVIDNLCYAGQVPFIPAMCETEDGQKLVVDADATAARIASELNAEKLVFLGSNDNCFSRDILGDAISCEAAELKITEGALNEQTVSLVQTCLMSLKNGVGKVHLVDGLEAHSLLLEIYTNVGVGTTIG